MQKPTLKFDPYLFEKLDVGDMPVYIKNIPWANGFVYVRVRIAVGARSDPEGKEGLAHFFEHLPFNGCPGWPTFGDIERVSRTLFLDTLNASTSLDHTYFSAKVGSDRLGEAMSFFADFVFKPLMRPEDVERERKVIAQELWRRYDSDKDEELARTVRSIEYAGHPFSRMDSSVGWHKSVADISHDDLAAFHRDHYHLGNAEIVIAGDIDEKRAREALEDFVSSCPQGRGEPRPKIVDEWPLPRKPEFKISSSEYFGLSGDSVPRTTNIWLTRKLPLLENGQLLQVGMNMLRQILFERVRGKLGAVYSPSALADPFADHYSVEIGLRVPPESAVAVQEIILEAIKELGLADAKHSALFEETKRYFLERKLFYDPSVCDVANDATSELSIRHRIISAQKECDMVSELSYRDIAGIFKEHLAPEKLFWVVMTP